MNNAKSLKEISLVTLLCFSKVYIELIHKKLKNRHKTVVGVFIQVKDLSPPVHQFEGADDGSRPEPNY